VTDPPVAAIAVNPPIAKPDPRKKLRRSIALAPLLTMTGDLPDLRVYPFVFFLSILFLLDPASPEEFLWAFKSVCFQGTRECGRYLASCPMTDQQAALRLALRQWRQ
jgi:hypothetical protein